MKKSIRDKNRRSKNTRGPYIAVIAGMLLLVIAALFLPQLLFGLQDYYNMQKTELAERDKFDIANLNLIYESQLSTRLQQFAEEEKHYVTSIEYDVSDDDELSNILMTTLQQDYIYILYGNGFLSDDVFTTVDKMSMDDRMEDNAYYVYIKAWKKYIFYGEELEKGVTLMAWYLDFFLLDGTEIKMLADVESGTIYYLKATGSYSTVWSGWNGENSIENRQKSFFENCQEYLYFYSTYYEANAEILDELFPEKEVYNSVVYGVEGKIREEKETELVREEIEDNIARISYPLHYGEYSLLFCFEADFIHDNNICPDIAIGIPTIGELVPEMIQN